MSREQGKHFRCESDHCRFSEAGAGPCAWVAVPVGVGRLKPELSDLRGCGCYTPGGRLAGRANVSTATLKGAAGAHGAAESPRARGCRGLSGLTGSTPAKLRGYVRP